jgi:uncharacterized protein involved in outer membrane biogenesis
MKGILKLIIFLVVIIAILVAGRNVFGKLAMEQGVKAATGLTMEVKEFNMGLSTTDIGIKELSLLNPAGFTDKVMFHAPEIFVDYDLAAMLKGKVHIEDIRLDFDQFVVVKNKDGQLNLEALKPKAKEKEATQAKEEKAGAPKKAPSLQIDHLALKVGKVVYKDYSRGAEPAVTEYNVNISEEMNDVTDPNSIMSWIATKAMMQTALGSLGNLNVDVGEVSTQAVESLQGEMQSLKDKIQLPFGQ